MPQYSYEKTFTAGTTEATQEEKEMPCHWGILKDVHISFRWGTGRLCHVHIDESLHQIFPTNPEGNYAFDGYTLPITDEYVLLPGVSKIYLRGWNEGSYNHTVAVAFKIEIPERLSKVEKLLERQYELFKELMYGKA